MGMGNPVCRLCRLPGSFSHGGSEKRAVAKPAGFFAGVLTPPPAPQAPAYAGFCTGKWYACVVVVRLMRCKSSPFAAFYDGKGICFAPQGATAGDENPPHPLAAACNACRN